MDFPKLTHISATADNGIATVSVTANSGESIYLTNITASFDGTVSNISITVKDGSTIVWEETLPDQNSKSFNLPIPLKITAGNTLNVELEASGTGGTSGTLHVWTYKGE